MFYLRILGVAFWAFFASAIWTVRALFQWGNPSLFSRSGRFFSWGIFKALGIKVEVLDEKNLTLNLPNIYIANHQSALDAALLSYICPPKAVPIGKKEIGLVPIIGWWFVGCGGRLIDRKNRERAVAQLKAVADEIRNNGMSVGILPEGTRNRKGYGMLPFKKGAFYLAIETQVPIVPIVIEPLHKIANFDSKTINPGTIRMKILPPVPTKGLKEEDVEGLISKCHELMEKTLGEFA